MLHIENSRKIEFKFKKLIWLKMDFRSNKCDRKRNTINTNPRYPNFMQPIFTAGDIDQFNSIRARISLKKIELEDDLDENIYKNIPLIHKWSKYSNINSRTIANTFDFLFNSYKKGIFVKIHDNKLKTFLPFSNMGFINNWSEMIKVDPKWASVKEFLDYTSSLAGYKPGPIKPTEEWYANNSLVRYENPRFETSNNLTVLYDMFKTLCETRDVPDLEFFLNKRDFPILTRDGTEAYNNLFGSKSVPSKTYKTYAPIFSSSVSDRYSDILIPTYEDWMRVVYQKTGNVILYECKEYPIIQSLPWEQKKKIAIFRGSTTGTGVTDDTNQRLKALKLSIDNPTLLDVGITNWNTRPRKIEENQYLQTIERTSYPKSNRLTSQEQSNYAYILNLEGHVAAYRLSYEMSYESVILLVDSEWKMWFNKFLVPWEHYVPVKQDLSDLILKIEWCINHDEECKILASNAKKFYDEFLGMDSILDYLQKTVLETSAMTGIYDYVPDLLEAQLIVEVNSIEKFIGKINNLHLDKIPIKYPPPNRIRNLGSLNGQWLSFLNEKYYNKIATLNETHSRIVNRTQIGPAILIEKIAKSVSKEKEYIHETFIGFNATNELTGVVPNFAYIFGPKDENYKKIYVEDFGNMTFHKWLDTEFDWDIYLHILLQLNLALKVAQNRCAFMHYDLYPWNVMIHKLAKETSFEYRMGPDFVLKINTKIIPVMIDFGKSRAVIFSETNGLIDYGFVNMYKTNQILDTLTILISSLYIIQNKISRDKINSFEKFFSKAGNGNIVNNLKMYKKYGKLFNLVDSGLNPKNFIDYMITVFGKMKQLRPKLVWKMEPIFMQNPIMVYYQMVSGNNKIALAKVLAFIDKTTFPKSNDAFIQRYITRELEFRTAWVDDASKDLDYEERWNSLKHLLFQMPKITSHHPNFQLPIVNKIYLDSEITFEEIKTFSDLIFESNREDWKTVLIIFNEAIRAKDIDASQIPVVENAFDYLSSFASINTLKWIANLKNEINI